MDQQPKMGTYGSKGIEEGGKHTTEQWINTWRNEKLAIIGRK
jgi:hypothetical protein